MIDLVIGAVNRAVDYAQGDERPRANDQPAWSLLNGKRYRDEGVEQDRNLEEIPEIVRSLDVFQADRHLGRRRHGLGMNALGPCFAYAPKQEQYADTACQYNKGERGTHELNGVCMLRSRT